jgi:peptidyl-prolyl cis-trans isomerase C
MKRCTTPTSQCLRVLAGCLSVLLIVVAIQGCKKQSTAPQPGKPGAGTTTQTSKPKTDAVVVKVNGSPIMESDLDKRIMRMIAAEQNAGNPTRPTPEEIDRYKKMLRVKVIDVLVSEKLLDQQIDAAGKKMTDQDVVAEVNTQGATMNPPMTFDQYKKLMIENGQDFNDIMASLRVDLSRQKFVESKLAGKGDVNEVQAKAYYDANVKRLEQPEKVRASHILIIPAPSDPNTDPNQARLAAKQKAEKLLEKIKAGADFAALAKSDSNDGSAAQGGDLGFFSRGEMEKPFEDAAFDLEPNKVSNVVETRYGYHIIKMTEHRAAGAVPFDEIKKDIIAMLTEQTRGQALYEFITALRTKAKIEYTSPNDAPTPEPALEAMPAPAAAAATPQADANQPKRPADANQK